MKKWFKALTRGSLHDWNELEDTFLREWGSKVNLVQALIEYDNLEKASHESVQDFSKRFNKVYNSIPAHIEHPPRADQLHYAEGFDYEFSFIAEREGICHFG